MIIRIPFTPLLFDLFPDAHGDRDALLRVMKAYYTVRGVAPEVSFEGNDILLQVDSDRIEGRERLFREAVRPCDKASSRKALRTRV